MGGPFGTWGASMGWHGNASHGRKEDDIVDGERIHLPALEPRGAVMADIGLDGQTVRVIGLHLELSGLWRRRQAAAIIAHIEVSTDRSPTVSKIGSASSRERVCQYV